VVKKLLERRELIYMEKLRLFIALPLTSELRRKLGVITASLSEKVSGIRWSRAENIHLTLKFLGDVEGGKVGGIKRILRETAARHGPLKLEVGKLGVFPGFRRPRVIWAGVQPEGGGLKLLVQDLEQSLSRLGFDREGREYTPHLTLGRVKRGRLPLDLRKIFSSLEVESLGRLRADVILLLKSTLTGEGPLYETISREKLSPDRRGKTI
jgi:2'-5' RNA ligase